MGDSVTAELVVTAAVGGDGGSADELPNTGSEPLPLIAAALGLLLVGLGAVRVARLPRP